MKLGLCIILSYYIGYACGTWQVLVVSLGNMIYSGPKDGLVPWLSAEDGLLRYGCGPYGPYCPARHGVAADWVMDLVNVGFRKPKVSPTDRGPLTIRA